MKQYAAHQLDFYKTGHHEQYPSGTEYVYSNLTARSGKHSNIIGGNGIIFVGLQLFIKEYLIDEWNSSFFNLPKKIAIDRYHNRVSIAMQKNINVGHLEKLHDLGYLPIRIKALPEGSFVPYKVPMLTIVNTHPDFYWVTNMLESVMSSDLWQMINTATTTVEYLKNFYKYAEFTGADKSFVPFQAHDFSFRGMAGREAAARSSFAALACGSMGTDSVPGLDVADEYYGCGEVGTFLGGSVSATEHSVMCAGMEVNEYDTFKRLITEVYPTGNISIVSDTWDFWNVMSNILPRLKDDILSRDGKVIIRPDSGNPVDIICGDDKSDNPYVKKGLVECLWDIFGGHINDKGYKVLNDKIGAIYGDSITLDYQIEILNKLYRKKFASSNIVLGIGSYTYQYNTRDTHGLAVKATSVVINGERRDIYKNPKTDDGVKKSAKGLLMVINGINGYELVDSVDEKQEKRGCLEVVFENGKLVKNITIHDIRKNVGKLYWI